MQFPSIPLLAQGDWDEWQKKSLNESGFLEELQRSQSEDHAGIFGSDVEESINALLDVSHPTDVD